MRASASSQDQTLIQLQFHDSGKQPQKQILERSFEDSSCERPPSEQSNNEDNRRDKRTRSVTFREPIIIEAFTRKRMSRGEPSQAKENQLKFKKPKNFLTNDPRTEQKSRQAKLDNNEKQQKIIQSSLKFKSLSSYKQDSQIKQLSHFVEDEVHSRTANSSQFLKSFKDQQSQIHHFQSQLSSSDGKSFQQQNFPNHQQQSPPIGFSNDTLYRTQLHSRHTSKDYLSLKQQIYFDNSNALPGLNYESTYSRTNIHDTPQFMSESINRSKMHNLYASFIGCNPFQSENYVSSASPQLNNDSIMNSLSPITELFTQNLTQHSSVTPQSHLNSPQINKIKTFACKAMSNEPPLKNQAFDSISYQVPLDDVPLSFGIKQESNRSSNNFEDLETMKSSIITNEDDQEMFKLKNKLRREIYTILQTEHKRQSSLSTITEALINKLSQIADDENDQ